MTGDSDKEKQPPNLANKAETSDKRPPRKAAADKKNPESASKADERAKQAADISKNAAAIASAASTASKRKPVQKPAMIKCRVVGIGASAGGLEPFEKFFDHMPDNSGFAFVIIQHLSPDFRSMMDELLNRHSSMKIQRVEDGMSIQPNVIYLNPPRMEMEILNGRFALKPVPAIQSLHLPINTFLKSLAEEKGPDAIAIILSGTGSDGTDGALAVHHAGGTVLVQEPESAKFEGMPRSAIDAMDVNGIAHPHQLAELVTRLSKGEAIKLDEPVEATNPKEMIFDVLRNRYSTDFSYYKNATIERRLMRRAELLNLDSLSEYAQLLKEDDEELDALYADLLIEVTEFFRDDDAFKSLEQNVFPDLLDVMTPDRPLRIWVPGCASGEEVYSHAIALSEQARHRGVDLNLKILATDIHHRSLEAANAGFYNNKAMKKIPEELRERYFVKDGENYQIRPAIRQLVVFSMHNILRDPPFTRIDLVSCRNLLIYLNDTAQQKALAYFHFALSSNGFLFLGPSETVGGLSGEFELLDQRWRIFRKRRDVRLIESMTLLPRDDKRRSLQQAPQVPTVSSSYGAIRSNPRRTTDKSLEALLKRVAPPGFLLRFNGDILRVFGEGSKYLNVGAGDFSQRIDDLIIPELKGVISAALDRAKSSKALPFQRRVKLRDADGIISSTQIRLDAFREENEPDSLLILTLVAESLSITNMTETKADSVEDVETIGLLRQTIEDIERDLQSSEETLQMTIEELETSNEELQATNEELMASNEELQSTNEELHSVNEELYTVSAEHQRKIIELTELSGDMEHLLKATEIGTIFVDSNLNVRRFTPAASQAFNILYQDIGRPLVHITNRFGDATVVDTLREVIASGRPVDREVQVGEDYLLLRLLPYQRAPGEIAGAVITTIDITALKSAQMQSETLATRYADIVDDLSHFIVRWSAQDRKISYCNPAYLKLMDRERQDILGKKIEMMVPRNQRTPFLEDCAKMTPGDARTFLLHDVAADGQEKWQEGTIRAIGDGTDMVVEYQAIGRDITGETSYRMALERLSHVGNNDRNDPLDVLIELLDIGAEYFGMPLGTFGHAVGTEFHIHAITGGDHFGLSNDMTIALQQTFNIELVDREDPFSIHHASSSAQHSAHPSHIASGIESFIGQRILIGQQTIGTVHFASRTPRAEPFSDLEHNFMRILAEWIARRVERTQALADVIQAKDDLQMVIDNIRAKIWYRDDKGRILRLNKPAAKSMGTSIEMATGALTQDVLPDKAAKIHADDLTVIKSNEPLLDVIEEFTLPDGSDTWVKTDKIPYVDPSTGQKKILVIAMDITSLKEQEAELGALNDELFRKNERLLATNQGLEQFAHVASHDLQEPLRKLMQFTEYLSEDCGDDLSEDGQYFIKVISSSAQRMRSLVRGILSLSSASGQELVLEPLDISAVLHTIREDFDAVIDEAKAELSIAEMPSVTGDPTLVEQLFRNLISNALKYRDSETTPKIKISSKTFKKGGAEISISDNGIGFSQDRDKMVFEPFARLHDRKEYEGSGIGLAICRTVCERHGWDISVTSAPGHGSTFKIRIPGPQAG